jgi:hypothetical protein
MIKPILSISDSGVVRPTKKLVRGKSREWRGRYFGDADTNIKKYIIN